MGTVDPKEVERKADARIAGKGPTAEAALAQVRYHAEANGYEVIKGTCKPRPPELQTALNEVIIECLARKK